MFGDEKPRAVWKGWEYVTANGLHMYVSKRHVFVDGRPVCGVSTPDESIISQHAGDEPCRKCMKWEDKHEDEYEVI